MDLRKQVEGRNQQELEMAMRTLAATIREAGECLLDLQQAVETLHVANDAKLARAVENEAAGCIRYAMRR